MGAACNKRRQDDQQISIDEEEPVAPTVCGSTAQTDSQDAPNDASMNVNLQVEAAEASTERRISCAKAKVNADEGEYVIVLYKNDGDALGTQCEASAGGLIVRGVLDSGLVRDWNEAHPDEQVLPNDLIFDVNGVHGADVLIAEIRKTQPMVMCLRRSSDAGQAEAHGSSGSDQPCAPVGEAPELPAVSKAADAIAQAAAVASCSSVQMPPAKPAVQVQHPWEVAAAREQASLEVPGGEVRLKLKTGNEVDANMKDTIELQITLDRTSGASLGVCARPVPNEGILVIEGISDPEGLVGAWNKANPEYGIELGDRIVEINGVTGNANGLIAQCKDYKPLRMKILRDAPPNEGHSPQSSSHAAQEMQCADSGV